MVRAQEPGTFRVGRRLAQLACLAWLWSSLALAQPQGDEPGGVSTSIDPCVPVDVGQFQRVLALELGTSIDYRTTAAAEPGLTWVHLSCTDAGIELRLEDGVTRKSMSRVLDLSRVEPGSRTRLLALAVAEFVVASWVELRIVAQPAIQAVGPPPSQRVLQRVQAVVQKRTPVIAEASERALRAPIDGAWEVSTLFHLEVWSSDLGLMPAVAVRVGQRPADKLAFTFGADLGVTRVSVAEGQVALGLTSAMGALLYAARAGRTDFYAGGGGRFGFVHMAGVSADQRVQGRSFTAPYGGFLMLGRVAYRVTSAFHLLAELEAGLVTLPAQGRSGSKLVVTLDGAWLSAGVGLGWSF